MPLGEADNSKKLHRTISALYLNDELSDVVVHVDGQAFPAHSLILASQSDYFKALLHGPDKKTDLVLHDTTPDVFGDVLRYFYTGKIAFKLDVDEYVSRVLGLAKEFGLKCLQGDIVDDMCAHLFIEEPIPQEVLDILDDEAQAVIASDIFVTLPHPRVQELIERDTFYVKDELDVFGAVKKWGEGRTEEERKATFNAVRLPLISQIPLFTEVQPSGVYTDSEIVEARKMQISASNLKLRRAKTDSLYDRNLASITLGAKVISGTNPESLLGGEHEYSTTTGFTWHTIQSDDDQEGILVELDKEYKVNMLKLHLQDKDDGLMSYYVAVARQTDGLYRKVVDYTSYQCRGHQLLFFPSTPVRYLKVVGTANTVGDKFSLVYVECHYTSNPMTMIRGLLDPDSNQALVTKGAIVLAGMNFDGSMIDGLHSDNRQTAATLNEDIKVCLPQPVYIGSLRIFLPGNYLYNYYADVSIDNNTWTRVADKTNESEKAWQTIQFDKRPVSFIKFSAIKASVSGKPHKALNIRYMECPCLKI